MVDPDRNENWDPDQNVTRAYGSGSAKNECGTTDMIVTVWIFAYFIKKAEYCGF